MSRPVDQPGMGETGGLTKRQLEGLVAVATLGPIPGQMVPEHLIAQDLDTTIQGVMTVFGNLLDKGLVEHLREGGRRYWRLSEAGRARLLVAAMLA